jgi:tRNA(Arg) A34 adenosine deaminase TadA
MAVSEKDLQHLERCAALARIALDGGDEPFGSVLVDRDGRVLFEGHNEVQGSDQTRHPELAAAQWAVAHLDPAARAAAPR